MCKTTMAMRYRCQKTTSYQTNYGGRADVSNNHEVLFMRTWMSPFLHWISIICNCWFKITVVTRRIRDNGLETAATSTFELPHVCCIQHWKTIIFVGPMPIAMLYHNQLHIVLALTYKTSTFFMSAFYQIPSKAPTEYGAPSERRK